MQVAAQIRQNSKEYSDFVTDLHKWTSQAEREMSGSQEELIDLSVQESVVSSTQGKEYYKKWEEFDVEKELENVDYAVIKTDDSQKFKRVKEGLLRKEMGNEYYKKGFYKKALSEYTASLALDFNEKTLGNRALVWLKMEMYQECVNDCSKLIAMDAKCIKGYWRRGVAKCSLGDLDAARKDLEYALVLEPGNKSIREELQKVMDLLSVKKEVKPSRPERVRVEIKEIGVSTNEEIRAEEQPNQEFIVQDQKKENIKSLEKIIEIMDISEMELREPGCFMDFERDFKRVKKDKQVLYKYIKKLDPKKFKSLFANSFQEEYLVSMIEVLHDFYLKNAEYKEAVEILKNIVLIPRFNMIQMFLSKSVKQKISFLFATLDKMDFEELGSLKKKYKVN